MVLLAVENQNIYRHFTLKLTISKRKNYCYSIRLKRNLKSFKKLTRIFTPT